MKYIFFIIFKNLEVTTKLLYYMVYKTNSIVLISESELHYEYD